MVNWKQLIFGLFNNVKEVLNMELPARNKLEKAFTLLDKAMVEIAAAEDYQFRGVVVGLIGGAELLLNRALHIFGDLESTTAPFTESIVNQITNLPISGEVKEVRDSGGA